MSDEPYILGKDAKLYRNSGTYATPNWVEVGNISDLNQSDTESKADVTTRALAESGYRANVATLADGEISFKMVYDPDDADVLAFQTAKRNKASIEIICLDGDIDESGKKGLRMTCGVFKMSRNEELDQAITLDVVIGPTYAPHAPEFVVTGSSRSLSAQA